MSQTLVIVVGVIRRGKDVLLVHQRRSQDPHPSWALPGGRAETGETLADTLRREVLEETGLAVKQIGAVLGVTDTLDVISGNRYLAFIMDVIDWDGELEPADPDGVILAAEFLSPQEAMSLLESLPWPDMSRPSAAAVRGDQPPGTVWLFRQEGAQQSLLATHGVRDKNRM